MVRLIYFLIFLTSCNNSLYRPVFHPNLPKEGPKLYQQGFREGCNTGMTVYGNDIIRAQYSTDVKPYLMQNKMYRNAWKLGNRYCRFHVSQVQMEGTFLKGFGTPIFPNRMVANDGSLIRERVTDSFWMPLEMDNNLWFNGIDWPWSKIDNEPGTFDGISIGREGGVFGLWMN